MWYGFSETIMSDEGWNFESKLVTELCQLAAIKKLATTPYHPQMNGQCKKLISTLITMVGKVPE